jgi:N6-L-threonylcarbamoyladenine synthase
MLHSGCLSFSFSGLKTAVRQWVENNGLGGLDDICASFQACAIEILCEKTRQAIKRKGYGLTAASGGVSNNKALREALTTMAREEGAHILFAAPELTGDNAAMIAAAGALRLARGERSQWREDVEPNLKLAS